MGDVTASLLARLLGAGSFGDVQPPGIVSDLPTLLRQGGADVERLKAAAAGAGGDFANALPGAETAIGRALLGPGYPEGGVLSQLLPHHEQAFAPPPGYPGGANFPASDQPPAQALNPSAPPYVDNQVQGQGADLMSQLKGQQASLPDELQQKPFNPQLSAADMGRPPLDLGMGNIPAPEHKHSFLKELAKAMGLLGGAALVGKLGGPGGAEGAVGGLVSGWANQRKSELDTTRQQEYENTKRYVDLAHKQYLDLLSVPDLPDAVRQAGVAFAKGYGGKGAGPGLKQATDFLAAVSAHQDEVAQAKAKLGPQQAGAEAGARYEATGGPQHLDIQRLQAEASAMRAQADQAQAAAQIAQGSERLRLEAQAQQYRQQADMLHMKLSLYGQLGQGRMASLQAMGQPPGAPDPVLERVQGAMAAFGGGGGPSAQPASQPGGPMSAPPVQGADPKINQAVQFFKARNITDPNQISQMLSQQGAPREVIMQVIASLHGPQ